MIHTGAALIAGVLFPPSHPSIHPPPAARTLHVLAPSAKADSSSSEWLEVGRTRQQEGDYVGAGQAYRQAFEALSERRQRATEGANAARLSAKAYWRAFDEDSDVAHLQDGLEVLRLWLERTRPGRHADTVAEVRRMAAQIRAVVEPLAEGNAALAEGDFATASDAYDQALDALVDRERGWPVGARITLRLVDARVSAYERAVASREDGGAGLAVLDEAQENLVQCAAQQQRGDEVTEEGVALKRLLAKVEALRNEAEQALIGDEGPPLEPPKKPPEPILQPPRVERTGPAVLLSVGLVGIGAGASLIGESIVFGRVAGREVERLGAEAEEEGRAGVYDENMGRIRAYEVEARRRNIGLLIGGSMLAVGGIAVAIVGIRGLRRAKRSRHEDRVQLTPSVFRAGLSLSMGTRF